MFGGKIVQDYGYYHFVLICLGTLIMEDLYIGFMKTIGAQTVTPLQTINAVRMFLLDNFAKLTV